MISPGKKIDLELPLRVIRHGVEETLPLKHLLKRRTIISVYMKNNTGSCDRQNESLVAHATEFDRKGYDVIALSRDTASSHLKYAKKMGVTYTLASDPGDTFAKAADAIVEKSMYGKTYSGPARAAFVLDRNGTVLAVAEKVDTKDHAAQLQTLLAGLKPA